MIFQEIEDFNIMNSHKPSPQKMIIIITQSGPVAPMEHLFTLEWKEIIASHQRPRSRINPCGAHI